MLKLSIWALKRVWNQPDDKPEGTRFYIEASLVAISMLSVLHSS